MSTPQLSPKMSKSDLDKFLSDAFGIATNPFPVDDQATHSPGLGTAVPVKLSRLSPRSRPSAGDPVPSPNSVPAFDRGLSPQSRPSARDSVPSPGSPGSDLARIWQKRLKMDGKLLIQNPPFHFSSDSSDYDLIMTKLEPIPLDFEL